ATSPVGTPAGTSTAAPSHQSTPLQTGSAESKMAAAGNAIGTSGSKLSADAPAKLGFQLDAHGNAIGIANHANPKLARWWKDANAPVVVKYDFRDQGNFKNQITPEQKALAVQALNAWSDGTGGKIIFVQDTTASASQIINIGVGNLQAFGDTSGTAGTLGL